MFAKILHANDGSEHAFHALSPPGGEIRAPRHAGKLGRSWATRRHSTMPVTLLGAACRPSGDLTTKNNHSRYHENNY